MNASLKAARLDRPLTSFAPRAVLTLEVVLHQLLDLADDSVREAWDITSSDLQTESEYTKCHAVARVARRAGYEAIRFPSATGSGINFAVFYDCRHAGSYVELRSVEELNLAAV